MKDTDLINVLRKEKVAIFCAGVHGKLFYRVLKTCGIKIECFVDNSDEKWGKIIIDDIICVAPGVLQDEKYILFVCVGKNYFKAVTDEVFYKYRIEVHTITEFIDSLVKNDKELYFKILFQYSLIEAEDMVFELAANRKFIFNDKKAQTTSKIAVYTAVFGDYDGANYCEYLGDNVDLYFVSDKKPPNLPKYYKWLDAKAVIPSDIESPIKRNRFVKMKPYKFLRQYEYSIYIDGNIKLKGDLSSFVRKTKSGISVFMHSTRDCIYQEAISVVNLKRVNADDVIKQMERYINEGMPSRYGLGEMPVIAREHNKLECKKVMEKWWEEFDKGSQRDQLSFMYAMWKNDLLASDLGCLGYDVRSCKSITFFKHSIESKNIKNEINRQINLESS